MQVAGGRVLEPMRERQLIHRRMWLQSPNSYRIG
jgi:hypothetical protein